MADQTTPIEALQELVGEVDANKRRLMRDRNITAEQVHAELHETLLPLIKDVAMACAQGLASIEQYIQDEVEPILAQAEGETQIAPEDAALLMGRLSSYRALMQSMLDQTTEPSRKSEIEEEIKATDAAIELVTETTIEVEDDDPNDPEETEAQAN